MKQKFFEKYIEINAVMENINIHRKNILSKFIPRENDSDDIVITKGIYLEDVPNLNELIEHIKLYKTFFEKYKELNKRLILHFEGKNKKDIIEKKQKKEEVDEFIDIEEEEDNE